MPQQTDAEKILAQQTDEAFRAATTVAIERLQFMRQAGITFGGARDLYEIFGYDRTISVKQYRDRYSRGGVAGRIVDALPKSVWRMGGELVEDDNPDNVTVFEQAWDSLNKRLNIWPTLQKVDILSRLSTYAILLLGDGEADMSQELKRSTKADGSGLLYITPFIGGGGPGMSRSEAGSGGLGAQYIDAQVDSWEEDPTSPRFGLPLTYKLKRTSFASTALQVPIHWTRVIHVAENTLDDEVYGQPALERVWNLLDDLEKVTGGGAEAFFLRANQGTQFDIDKDMKDLGTEQKKEMAQQIEDYKNSISRILRTRGVKVKTLGSDVADFSSSADAILTQIAGASTIPKRILTGSEMGELASTQDRDNWKDQVMGRQTEYAEPFIVKRLVDRLIDYGYLPKPKEYKVSWPHIETLTEDEKAKGAQAWAQTNSTNGSPVFTEAEIRDHWYGMDPLSPEQLAEEQSRKPQPPVPGQDGNMDPRNEDGNNAQPRAAMSAADENLILALSSAIDHQDPTAIVELLHA